MSEAIVGFFDIALLFFGGWCAGSLWEMRRSKKALDEMSRYMRAHKCGGRFLVPVDDGDSDSTEVQS